MNRAEIKIPTFLGILLVLAIVGTIASVTNFFLKSNSFAKATQLPQTFAVSTITDSGFTLTWQTDEPTMSGAIITYPDGSKQTFFDERHILGDKTKYTTTSISISGLQPETVYGLTVLVDGKTYTIPEYDVIRTGHTLPENSNGMSPVYGSVFLDENVPANGGLVFLTIGEDSQVVSGLIKPSGSWILPLNRIRTKALDKLITKSEEPQQISLTIRLAGKEATVVTDTLNSSPVPDVFLGNNYDFRGAQHANKGKEREMIANNSSFSSVLGTQSASPSSVIALTSPADGSAIPGDPPQISGRGVPGNFVTLLIGSSKQADTTSVLPDGTWVFNAKNPIGSGKQRITMTTLDSQKKPVAITHTFEILKSGTQVLGDATPSATIRISPKNTPTPLVTTAPSPSPTLVVTATPKPNVPTTATTAPTNLILLLGFGLVLLGLVVFAI